MIWGGLRLGLWLVLALLWGLSPRPARAHIDLWTADLLLRDTATLPSASDPGWRRVDLPHILHDDDPRATGAWFRFRFAGPSSSARSVDQAAAPPPQSQPALAAAEPQALYLFWANENAAFYFNGSFLGDGGRLRAPLARHWNAPFYFLLPAPLWRAENEILIYLRCDPGWGLLSPLRVGPASSLRAQYVWRYFLQVELTRGLGIALLLASSLALSAWWWRRSDRQYLWFGLACLSWSGFSFYQGLLDPPQWPPQWPLLSPLLWRWLAHVCIDAWTVFFLRYVLHLVDQRRPRLEAALMAFVGVSALLGAPHGLFFQGASFLVTHSLGMLAAFALAVTLRVPLRRHRLLRLCFGILLLASLHDLIFALPWRWFPTWFHSIQIEHRFFAAHYAAPLVLLVLTRSLARRFVQSLVETETLNRELESRVAASAQALQDSYARRAQMERQSAAHAERERIYRDLHDDIGAMLLSLAIRAKDAQDAELARSALRSLREVVSQAGQSQIPLLDRLADWRAEIAGRLGDAGLELIWQQPDSLPGVTVSATAALHLGRILREAVSNIVHHAQASQVEIAITTLADPAPGYRLVIADNGSTLARPPGRGMRNMQSRAGLIGATIRWDFSDRGCRITLDLPTTGLTDGHKGRSGAADSSSGGSDGTAAG